MIDSGGPRGITNQYREKLEQERGIPIWVRVGLEGPLHLIGYVEPERGYSPQVHVAKFFREVAKAFEEYQGD